MFSFNSKTKVFINICFMDLIYNENVSLLIKFLHRSEILVTDQHMNSSYSTLQNKVTELISSGEDHAVYGVGDNCIVKRTTKE